MKKLFLFLLPFLALNLYGAIQPSVGSTEVMKANGGVGTNTGLRANTTLGTGANGSTVLSNNITSSNLSAGAVGRAPTVTFDWLNGRVDVPGTVTAGNLIVTNSFDWTKAITNGLVLNCWSGSGFVLSGTNISQWNDASGNGNHLSMATAAKQPTLLREGQLSGAYWSSYGAESAPLLSLTNLNVSFNASNFTYVYVFQMEKQRFSGALWSPIGNSPATILWTDLSAATSPFGSVFMNNGLPVNTFPILSVGCGLQFMAISSSSRRVLTVLDDRVATNAPYAGAVLTGGTLGNWADAFYFNGKICAVLIFNRALAALEIEYLRAGANEFYGIKPKRAQINCIGDSKTEGYYADGGYGWPGLIAKDTSLHVMNFGKSGAQCTTADGWTNATLTRNSTLGTNGTVPVIIDIINIGLNDARFGTNAAAIWSAHTNMAATFRAAGHKVIDTQITYTGVAATDTIITNLNGLISSNWSTWFDAYVPFDGDPIVGKALSSQNTQFWLDSLHENNAGYLYEYPFYKGAVDRVLGSNALTVLHNGTVGINGLRIGPGNAVLTNTLYASGALDFPNTLAQTDSDLPITVAGASEGDLVELGFTPTAALTGSTFSAFASNGTVFVRLSVYGLAAKDPASATFKVRVDKFQ